MLAFKSARILCEGLIGKVINDTHGPLHNMHLAESDGVGQLLEVVVTDDDAGHDDLPSRRPIRIVQHERRFEIRVELIAFGA